MKDSVKIANDVSSAGNNNIIGMNVRVWALYLQQWQTYQHKILPEGFTKNHNPHCTPERSDLDLPYKLNQPIAMQSGKICQ